MATFGNWGQLLATDGNFWQLMAIFGNFWLLMAFFGNCCCCCCCCCCSPLSSFFSFCQSVPPYFLLSFFICLLLNLFLIGFLGMVLFWLSLQLTMIIRKSGAAHICLCEDRYIFLYIYFLTSMKINIFPSISPATILCCVLGRMESQRRWICQKQVKCISKDIWKYPQKSSNK